MSHELIQALDAAIDAFAADASHIGAVKQLHSKIVLAGRLPEAHSYLEVVAELLLRNRADDGYALGIAQQLTHLIPDEVHLALLERCLALNSVTVSHDELARGAVLVPNAHGQAEQDYEAGRRALGLDEPHT